MTAPARTLEEIEAILLDGKGCRCGKSSCIYRDIIWKETRGLVKEIRALRKENAILQRRHIMDNGGLPPGALGKNVKAITVIEAIRRGNKKWKGES